MAMPDFNDLLIGETVQFPKHGVGGQAILAFVDLTDNEVDDLASLARDAALGVLQCQVSGKCRLRKGKRGVEVGNHPKALFEIIEKGLVAYADFFVGRNGDGGYGDLLMVVENEGAN